MKLRNLKKVPFEIATLLATDDTIIRLIYDDSASALTNKTDLSVSTQELINSNYIGFYPATETGIREINRNTFIVINLEDFALNAQDQNTRGTGAIYITTDKAHCLLDGNKIRLLELADRIETILDNRKLSVAGELQLTAISYVVFSDFRAGYRISFRCSDQSSRKAEL